MYGYGMILLTIYAHIVERFISYLFSASLRNIRSLESAFEGEFTPPIKITLLGKEGVNGIATPT